MILCIICFSAKGSAIKDKPTKKILTTYNRENLRSDQQTLFERALEEATNNAVWKIKIDGFVTPGNRALDCANYLAGLFKVMEESKRMDFLDMVNNRL